jgi:2-polyprenyl-6-methoxyphenol hydroxylase-like FAD-dependent oxidoreductase
MKSPEKSRTAIIVGGGIAGLAAGNALRRAGFNIAIYEQAPTLEPRGAALSLWPNAKQALKILGLAELGSLTNCNAHSR